MGPQDLPTLTCVDTGPAFRLIHQLDDADFPERAAYVRALLVRTAADLRSTADFLEERLKGVGALDYVQSMKRAMADGESLAAILEGVGQVINEMPLDPKSVVTVLKKIDAILRKVNEAQELARKAEL